MLNALACDGDLMKNDFQGLCAGTWTLKYWPWIGTVKASDRECRKASSSSWQLARPTLTLCFFAAKDGGNGWSMQGCPAIDNLQSWSLEGKTMSRPS